MFYQFDPLICL
jgi:hypothetical protein